MGDAAISVWGAQGAVFLHGSEISLQFAIQQAREYILKSCLNIEDNQFDVHRWQCWFVTMALSRRRTNLSLTRAPSSNVSNGEDDVILLRASLNNLHDMISWSTKYVINQLNVWSRMINKSLLLWCNYLDIALTVQNRPSTVNLKQNLMRLTVNTVAMLMWLSYLHISVLAPCTLHSQHRRCRVSHSPAPSVAWSARGSGEGGSFLPLAHAQKTWAEQHRALLLREAQHHQNRDITGVETITDNWWLSRDQK